MSQKNTILGGALLLTTTNLLLRLISIGFNVFLAERIGAAGLGLLQLISTVGLFALLTGTGGIRVAAMCLAAEEFGHRRPGGVKQAVSVCLRWGLLLSNIVGAAVFFLAEPVACRLLVDCRAALSLRVMGLFLPVSCLCGIITGYFTASGNIRRMVGVEIAERILSLLLTTVLLLLWAGQDLSRACCAIVIGSSLGATFDFLLLYLFYRHDMHRIPSLHEGAMRKRLAKLSVPLALNDLLRAGLNTVEQLLIPFGLAQYAGSAQEAMANYGTIHAMVFPVLMFPAAILFSVSDLLVPELSRSRAMGRTLRIVDLTEKCLRLTMLFSCAVAGFLFLCSDALGERIYGSPEAGFFLRFFAPMAVMLYLDAITDGMLKGLAEQVSTVRYNTFTSLLDVIFLFILLPRFGIGGYLFTFVVTHAINLFLSLRRLLRTSTCVPQLRSFFLPLLCALLTLPPLLLLPATSLLRGVIYLLLLFAAYLLSDALLPRDCQWIRRVLRRSTHKRS